MNDTNHELIAITYVGTRRLNFYKDCSKNAERLELSLANFGIQLVVYNFSDLRKLVRFPESNFFYFFTRYGAGSWFWKPILILDALTKYNPRTLIYLDADCMITKDPRKVIADNLILHDVAVFGQNFSLQGWISPRAAKILGMGKEDIQKADLLTAGIVILKNSFNSRIFLNVWSLGMKDPRVLLHPAIRNATTRHRHDQAVLSALVSKGEITCNKMSSGFYSIGEESLENEIEDAWVYTGELEPKNDNLGFANRLGLYFDYYSRTFYDLAKSAVITPIHLVFYLSQKGIFGDSNSAVKGPAA